MQQFFLNICSDASFYNTKEGFVPFSYFLVHRCHNNRTQLRDLVGERAAVTGRQLERSYTDQIESVAAEVTSMWGATRFISQTFASTGGFCLPCLRNHCDRCVGRSSFVNGQGLLLIIQELHNCIYQDRKAEKNNFSYYSDKNL